MPRAVRIAFALVLTLSCTAVRADSGDQVLLGKGMHAYYRGELTQAFDLLTQAIAEGSKNPAIYYYRGLVQARMGRQPDAAADFAKGAELEAAGIVDSDEISRSLSRVQGRARVTIERYRNGDPSGGRSPEPIKAGPGQPTTAPPAPGAEKDPATIPPSLPPSSDAPPPPTGLPTESTPPLPTTSAPPQPAPATVVPPATSQSGLLGDLPPESGPTGTVVPAEQPTTTGAATSAPPTTTPLPTTPPPATSAPSTTAPPATIPPVETPPPTSELPKTSGTATTMTPDLSTPDGTVRAAVAVVADGQPQQLWSMLPAKHQQDIQTLIADVSQQMDPEVLLSAMNLLKKASQLLKDKQAYLASKGSMKIGDLPLEPAQATELLTGVSDTLQRLAASEISTVEGLATLDPQRFVTTNLSPLFASLMKQPTNAGGGEPRPLGEVLKAATIAVTSNDGSTAVVTLQHAGQESETYTLKQVDGKWLPAEMVDDWDDKIEAVRAATTALDLKGAGKDRALHTLGVIDGVLNSLLAAQTEEDFGTAMLGAMFSLSSLAGGGMPNSTEPAPSVPEAMAPPLGTAPGGDALPPTTVPPPVAPPSTTPAPAILPPGGGTP